MSGCDLSGCDLSGSYMSHCNMRGCDLSGCDLSGSYMRGSDLSGSYMSHCNMSGCDLSGSYMSHCDMRGCYMRGCNMSGCAGLVSPIQYMKENFDRSADGYIAYKAFNAQYFAPDTWKIRPGAVIEENVNANRTDECGCGINVAPLDWVRKNYKGDIWKVMIRWEWLPGVCVPYNTDGKIRCERVQLLEIVE